MVENDQPGDPSLQHRGLQQGFDIMSEGQSDKVILNWY
jgi:hypothetical protein